jgi:predicted ABC-type ATPase
VIGELREAAADELAEVSVAKLKRSGVSGHDIAVGNRNAAAIKRQADAAKAANDPEFEKKHPRGRGQQGGQFVRKGSTDSEAVRDAQRRLGVKRDGVFGSQTLEAVKELQRKAGLTVDGVIGHATMRALLGKRTSKADEGALTAADRSALRRDKPRRRRSGVSTAPGAGYGRSREAEELVEESLLGELAEASIFSVARRGWSETLHPRGRGGRFADKPDVPKAAPSRNPARSGPRNTPKPKVSPLRPDAPRGPERPSSNEARKIGEKELPGMVGTGPWSKAVPELTAKLRAGSVEDSESFFRPGGRAYPPERVALHARIVNLMLQGAGAHQQPEALFLAGGPASGKSTLVNSGRARPKPDAVDVNPDIVRTMLPEYQALVAAGDEGASAKVHEEASHISKMVMNLALMRRHHVTVDGTGNGGPGAFSRKIEAARGAGLSVRVVYSTIDTEEAVSRAKARAARSGRVVPEGYLRSAHAAVSERYLNDVSKLGVPIEVYDNNGKKPKLIAQHDASGRLNVVNKRLFESFVEKADPQKAALRKLQRENDAVARAVQDLFGDARPSDAISAAAQRDRAAARRLGTRTRRAD